MRQRIIRTLFFRIGLSATLTCGLSLNPALSTAFGNNLPELGSPANRVMSESQADKIGHQIVATIQRQMTVIKDPLIHLYFNNLGEHLADPIRSSGKKTHLFILKDSAINAFSLPGGYIGLNSGMIMATSTESQLAAVIAHESAHVMQNHIARRIAESKAQRLPLIAGIIAAAALGASGSGNGAMGALMGSMAGAQQAQLSFTRHEEKEADDIGIISLQKSGFDPYGMAQFLQIMQQANMSYANKNIVLGNDHPEVGKRISEAQNRAHQLPAKKDPQHIRYYQMKALMFAILHQNNARKFIDKNVIRRAQESKREYNLLSNNFLSNKKNQVKVYKTALLLMYSRQWNQAQKLCDKLLQKSPESIWYELLSANISTQRKNKKQTIEKYQKLVQLYPDNYAIVISAYNAYRHIGKYALALELVNRKLMDHPRSAELYHMQARCLSNLHRYHDATLSLAQAALFAKNYRYARQILHPLQKAKLTLNQRRQLRALLQRSKH